MDKEKVDYDKLRKHFRKETQKLDNWLYHHRIDEYFKKTSQNGKSEETE